MKNMVSTLLIIVASSQVFAKSSLQELEDATFQFKTSSLLEMQFDKAKAANFEFFKDKEEGIKYRIPYVKALRHGNHICVLTHTEKLNAFDPDYAKKEPIFLARMLDQKPLTLDPERVWTLALRSNGASEQGTHLRFEAQKTDGSTDKINMRCFEDNKTELGGTPLEAADILALFKSKQMIFMKGGKPLSITKEVIAKPEAKTAVKKTSSNSSVNARQ